MKRTMGTRRRVLSLQTAVLRMVIGLCVFVWISCIQDVEDVVYTVTVTRPAGGAISADPTSGAAGTVIALTNSPDDDYAFSHYTVDGAAQTENTFSLNKDVTVSGVFTPKPAQSNSITIGNITATLDPATGELVIPDYADPAAIGPITLSAEDKGKLAGKALSVDIQKGTGASDTVSLAYVHYLREALLSAAPAGVAIDATGLTPVFKESEWWAANNSNQTVTDLYSAYSSASVYSNFGTGGIEIMDGIKVFKDSGDNKPMIAYNRPIKIAKIALGTGNQYGASYTFHGLGLKKESSG